MSNRLVDLRHHPLGGSSREGMSILTARIDHIGRLIAPVTIADHTIIQTGGRSMDPKEKTKHSTTQYES
jgi:hypothetical protein